MKWFIHGLKNYTTFEGRARRKEYWMFMLVYLLINLILRILVKVTGPETYFNEQTYTMETTDSSAIYILLTIIYFIFLIGTLLPTIAITVRRLHDTGRSGWWYFINFLPFVGSFILFIFLVLEGHEQENQYGPNPRTME